MSRILILLDGKLSSCLELEWSEKEDDGNVLEMTVMTGVHIGE